MQINSKLNSKPYDYLYLTYKIHVIYFYVGVGKLPVENAVVCRFQVGRNKDQLWRATFS